MQGRSRARAVSYVVVAAAPFLTAVLAAARGLRISGVHQSLGVVVFAALALAVWQTGWRSRAGQSAERTQLATAGSLFLAPSALTGLLWVGLGTPWDATAAENQMRYLVLAAMAAAVVAGFVVVQGALVRAGEPVFATLAVSAALLSGPLYLVWDVFMFVSFSAKAHAGEVPAVFGSLNEVLDALLFVAGALTYAAGALLALAVGRVRWIGRRPTLAFVAVCTVALALLLRRGLAFVAPDALAAPWYAVPGFVAGIPAVPFIVPALIGAALLRRAGEP